MNKLDDVVSEEPNRCKYEQFFNYKTMLIGVLIFLVGAFVYYANQLVLIIYPENNQQQVVLKVNKGESFYLEFINSVEKTPIQEYFIVRGTNDLLLQQARYKSLGVGLPFLASDGKLHLSGDGRFVLEMDRTFKSIRLRTGIEACPRIFYAGTGVPLYDLYSPGTLVEIKVDKRYKSWI
ncbi:MAG TPA: DUF1850 domain-containing protein [Candidatus Avacidaminococcus intestinavium]|uniref:DUF1850 domain-containing protein n=1 Tax=Candidatus Avacidaminococcus intestinavium TaxID=2840684 RepID=A0A9D1MQC6_9FIRM|nr:DUF1850 domain-containing protein [Candidatus Avacidaminococcus intestinavium]